MSNRSRIFRNNPNKQIEEESPWALIEGRASKTEKKRAFLRTAALAAKLSELPIKQVRQLPLSEITLFRFEEMARITSFEARRRQTQLLGKLLQGEDEEAIIEFLLKKQGNLAAPVIKWVTRLQQQEDLAINDFSRQYKVAEPHSTRIYLLKLQKAQLEAEGSVDPYLLGNLDEAEKAIRHYIFQMMYLSQE